MRIALYIVSIAVLQEILFRFIFPLPEISNFDRSQYLDLTKPSDDVVFLRDKEWYWESQLDTTAIFRHRMNRYGFRGNEWKLDKTSGRQRVFFVGDSFIEGIMTHDDGTIPYIFEQCVGPDQVEVMNGGMVGLAPAAYMQLISDVVPYFNPDVVMLCFFANDLGRYQPIIPTHYMEPRYYCWWTPRLIAVIGQVITNGPILPRWGVGSFPFIPSLEDPTNPWVENQEELWPHVTEKVRKAMLNGTHNPFRVQSLIKEEKYLKQNSQVRAYVDYFNFLSDKFGFEPVVVYLPSKNQVSTYYLPYEKETCLLQFSDTLDLTGQPYQRHQMEIAQECDKRDITFWDMTDIVREKEDSGERMYWNYDGHFRPIGYEHVAKNICEKYISRQ